MKNEIKSFLCKNPNIGFAIIFIGSILSQLYSNKAICQENLKKTEAKVKMEAINIEPRSIGDRVPDILFNKMLNYNREKAKLSDYKGKLVLLDFWHTTCSACIAAFPKMEKLQDEFKNQIQILLCNSLPSKYDTEEKIYSLLEKNKKRTGFYPSLPIPFGDTVLFKYFPHVSQPHIVWINSSGIVIAITRSEDVNAKNIRAALNNDLKIIAKNDFGIDPTKPLFVKGNGGEEKYLFRSIFTPFIDGLNVAGRKRINELNQIVGANLINRTLEQLVTLAYSPEIAKYGPSRLFLDFNKSQNFSSDVEDEFKFCYDIIVRPTKPELFKLSEYLKSDLEKFFRISFKIGRKNLEYYQINFENLRNGVVATDDSQARISDLANDATNKFVHNYSLADFWQLLEGALGCPIESDVVFSSKQRISADFPPKFDFNNKASVLDFLETAGFKIQKKQKAFEVAIITNKDNEN